MLHHAHANLGYKEEVFASQMDFLKNNDYHTVTLDQFLDWLKNETPLPIRPILLTVDDNYILVYTSMYPILKARGLHAVNFTITSSVGNTVGLHYCSWEQLREMEASGAMDNQSHTVTHPYLTQLTQSAARAEVVNSRTSIAANIPLKTCNYIAYPYGDYNTAIMGYCKDAGYAAAFAVDNQIATHASDIYKIPRMDASYDDLEAFKQRIGFNSLPPAPPGKGWTIDNTDPNFFANSSVWTFLSSTSAYGSSCLFHQGGEGLQPARWAAYLPKGGLYKVHAWWPHHPNLATNASYEIRHAGGLTTKVINQKSSGGAWRLLGIYNFTTDAPADIRLSDSANAPLAADGIWFEPISASGFYVY